MAFVWLLILCLSIILDSARREPGEAEPQRSWVGNTVINLLLSHQSNQADCVGTVGFLVAHEWQTALFAVHEESGSLLFPGL